MVWPKCVTASRLCPAVRHLCVVLVVAAAPHALRAEVYECVDANSYRYTNVISLATGCKRLNVLPPDTVVAAQWQANPLTTPSTLQLAELSAPRDAPDPSARLQAIEDWARGPQATLDTVTRALVDPDESVRARAQELWEETLKRR
jgi:hypothetical protein